MSPLVLSAPPLLDFAASDETDAIRGTADLLAGCANVVDAPGFLGAVFERQRINPPILGSGVAMPHARTPLVREIVFAAARLAGEVSFRGAEQPVRLVFLFGIPPHRISEYLAMTANLVRRLRNPGTLEGLLNTDSPDEFVKLLT